MLVGDLIYNNDFDLNCNFAIYSSQWNDNGTCLWSTKAHGYHKPPEALLDREIGYITLDMHTCEIVIEIKEEE